MADWNPLAYARFSDLRLRPALDLLRTIGPLPPGGITDLGCGAGVMARPLREAYPDAPLTGVDLSASMLKEARETGLYDMLEEADAGHWQPERPQALIFSNAALHWLPDHDDLLLRLTGLLMPGGVLAVQMPRQFAAASHRFLRDLAQAHFPDRFDYAHWQAPVHAPDVYYRLLAPAGRVSVWETEYLQRLPATADGCHPVRAFTESTAMRPMLARLTDDEAAHYIASYEAALASAYPAERDGSVLFPFRRLFLTLHLET
ncbi:MAG: methyltransferase domain-containing protein [Paracoccaceae bacterium]